MNNIQKSSLSILLFILAVSCVHAQEDSGDVVILNSSNFASLTANGDWYLLLFAPWCGHCTKFKPAYKQYASEVKGKVNVGQIDCTENMNICSAYEIRGYPTIFLQKGGIAYEFNGQRSVEGLSKFYESGFQSATSKPIPSVSGINLRYLAIGGGIAALGLFAIIKVLFGKKDSSVREAGETGETGETIPASEPLLKETPTETKEPQEKKND